MVCDLLDVLVLEEEVYEFVLFYRVCGVLVVGLAIHFYKVKILYGFKIRGSKWVITRLTTPPNKP